MNRIKAFGQFLLFAVLPALLILAVVALVIGVATGSTYHLRIFLVSVMTAPVVFYSVGRILDLSGAQVILIATGISLWIGGAVAVLGMIRVAVEQGALLVPVLVSALGIVISFLGWKILKEAFDDLRQDA